MTMEETRYHIGEDVQTPYRAFTDREDAGEQLAEFIGAEPESDSVVLALLEGQ